MLRNATGGATNYHAVWVSPAWAPTLEKTTQIGNHIFYRGLHGLKISVARAVSRKASGSGGKMPFGMVSAGCPISSC